MYGNQNIETPENPRIDEMRADLEAKRAEREPMPEAEDIALAKSINRIRIGGERIGKPIGRPRKSNLERQYFGADDLVACGIPRTTAERVIRECNREIRDAGGHVIKGLTPRSILEKKLIGIKLSAPLPRVRVLDDTAQIETR